MAEESKSSSYYTGGSEEVASETPLTMKKLEKVSSLLSVPSFVLVCQSYGEINITPSDCNLLASVSHSELTLPPFVSHTEKKLDKKFRAFSDCISRFAGAGQVLHFQKTALLSQLGRYQVQDF